MEHLPVLATALIKLLAETQLNRIIDATVGGGGHAAALLEAHPEVERLIGIDQDPVALKLAAARLNKWEDKVTLMRGNFADLLADLCNESAGPFDGIIMDLGVSSMQLDRPEKGFSFRFEGPLDMRMDPKSTLKAEEIVNNWSEKELGRLFRTYGEEKQWRRAARAIVEARQQRPIITTTALAAIIREALPIRREKKIDPATLVFQALRIAVNGELEVLEAALPHALTLLRSGGRLGVITFHSLEDRIVKNAFRWAASDKEETRGIGGLFRDKKPTINLITRKPIIATETESSINPRSRSAKLRMVEKR